MKINLPVHLTVDQFQQITNLEHLTDLDKTVKIVSILSEYSEEEIRKWDPNALPQVMEIVTKLMNHKESFYPIFKHEDTLYGFQNVDKMNLGEYVDLENLCKEPIENLHEIMAILYRPVETHNFNNLIFKASHKFMIAKNKFINVFKHYKVEKYNNEARFESADKLKEMPVQYALGALGFFLANASGYLTSTLPSSTTEEKEMKMMMEMTNLLHLANIGDGLRHFIRSPKQAFSLLQGKEVSLT